MVWLLCSVAPYPVCNSVLYVEVEASHCYARLMAEARTSRSELWKRLLILSLHRVTPPLNEFFYSAPKASLALCPIAVVVEKVCAKPYGSPFLTHEQNLTAYHVHVPEGMCKARL